MVGRPRKYSDEEVIAELRRVDSKVDGPLTQSEFDRLAKVSRGTVKRRFNDWNSGKEAAGLETIHRGYRKCELGCLSAGQKHKRIKQVKERVLCARCEEDYPSYVMDFHHISGDKVASITRMTNSETWEAIKEEMRKCEVLCANCHRIAEHGE